MKKNVFFYFESDFSKLDGIITQLIYKIMMFEKYLDVNTVVINDSLVPYAKTNFLNICKRRGIKLNAKIYNEIDFILKRDSKVDNNQEIKHIKHFKYVVDSNTLEKMGAINKYKNCIDHIITYDDISGKIKEISYYEKINDQIIEIKKDIYDENGYLYTSMYINKNTNKLLQQDFYDITGKIKIQMIYNQTKNIVNKVIVYNEYLMPEDIFDDIEDFKLYIREKIFSKYDLNESLIINDSINLYSELRKITKIDIYNTLHSNYSESLNENSSLDYKLSYILNDIRNDKHSFLICLTEAQINDLKQRIGLCKNVLCIPNVIKKSLKINENRNLQTLVVICRLEEIKRVDLAIKVFKKLYTKNKNLKLEIYGVGTQRVKLITLVQSLKLDECIKFKGFCDNPSDILKNSTLLINTSSYETYPVLLLESINEGCPVVSFDIKYGVNEIIKHNYNGLIIENNNITKMADEIYKLLNNKDKYEKMVKNCYEIRAKFTFEEVYKKWKDMIKGE